MRASLIATLITLVVTPAFAQMGNPGGMMPGVAESPPGSPAPGQYNTQDRLFIKLFGMGNLGEVNAGKLAASKASSPSVKSFGQQMANEHSATMEKLRGVAKPLGIALPGEPQPDQKATEARLESLEGPAFDVTYLQAQLTDHQKTAQLLEWEIGNGQEASVQRLAMEALPTVLEHLRSVQALMSAITNTTPQGLASVQNDEPTRKC